MKFLLSVIALCLVMITAKLYIPEAQADIEGLYYWDMANNWEFKKAVANVIEEHNDTRDAIIDIIEDCRTGVGYSADDSISC